jgi:ribokinase
MFGEQAVKGFIDDGINVDYVIKDENAPSGVAEIFVADDGENSIAVASGANANLSPADVTAAKDAIVNADMLVMQLESPLETIAAAAQLARKNGVQVILNSAPAQPLPDELLANVSILTPNESEAELLTGLKVSDNESAQKAADILKSKGIKTVIITMGAAGVFISSSEFTGQQSGFKVEPVDTTAAGDVFNGALAVGLSGNIPLLQAVKFAQAAAALSVTKLGAQPSAPNCNQIKEFLNAH